MMMTDATLSPYARKELMANAGATGSSGNAPGFNANADSVLNTLKRNLGGLRRATQRRRWVPYAVCVLVVAVSSAIGIAMSHWLDEENCAMIYLLGVVLIASKYGRLPSIITCLLSAVSYHYFVVAPHFALVKCDHTSLFTFVVMLVVAITMSHLTLRIQQQAEELERKVRERTNDLALANEALKVEVAQRMKAEEYLRGAIEELARSNTALTHFARIASHDLREPLRSMKGFADLLLRRYGGALDERGNEFIHHIVGCVRRMERLIDGILTHARVQRSDQQFTEVDLNHVLEEAMQNLHAAIQDADAQIVWDKLPVIKGDGPQLVQLFQNLLSNAIKFRGEEPLRIKVVCRPYLANTRNGGGNLDLSETKEWRISVADNGIGFDGRYADEIFTMFKRLHGGGAYPGNGIGLAICKSIVEKHGGRITVDSLEGGGSTFHMTFPMVAQFQA